MGEAPLVGIIMGSRSDWETMRHAAETLDELGVPYEKEVVSAHRTPDKLFAYAEAAESRGLQVIIAGAGGAAHLPGMTSSKTLLPVLGVPVESKTLQGLDSLLSIAQMPAGVPVGTLAIGRAGAVNAALLAAAIVARADEGVRERLAAYRASQTESVLAAPDPVGVTQLVGCIGGGQLGRMLALAGAPLDVRFRFLDPSPDACAGDVGELLVGAVRRSGSPRPPRRRRRRGHVRVRERPRRGCAAGRGSPRRPRARAGAGSSRREGALPQPRHPDRAVRLARGERPACAREVPAARLRRQGPTRRRVARRARGRRARGGGRVVRSRAVDRRGARTRRRDAPSTRSPRTSIEAGSSRCRALLRPTRRKREAEEIATKLLDALGYVGVLAVELFEVDGSAARERVRAARPQHRPLDDRRRGDEPVREPRPGGSRTPARLDGGARRVGHAQPRRRCSAARAPARRPRRARAPVREDASCGTQARSRDARRRGRGARRRGGRLAAAAWA